MTSRPYATRNIEQLEELGEASSGDPHIIGRLISELDHRRSSRAARLRSELIDSLRGETTPGGIAALILRPQESRTSERGAYPPVKTEPASKPSALEAQCLESKYEALRATFSVEGELLARWGMTPALPPDLRDMVFEEWRKRLPDDEGRLLEDLVNDEIRIRRERIALAPPV